MLQTTQVYYSRLHAKIDQQHSSFIAQLHPNELPDNQIRRLKQYWPRYLLNP